jgi:hypothetical protein
MLDIKELLNQQNSELSTARQEGFDACLKQVETRINNKLTKSPTSTRSAIDALNSVIEFIHEANAVKATEEDEYEDVRFRFVVIRTNEGVVK